jgi:hypothetical protein
LSEKSVIEGELDGEHQDTDATAGVYR